MVPVPAKAGVDANLAREAKLPDRGVVAAANKVRVRAVGTENKQHKGGTINEDRGIRQTDGY